MKEIGNETKVENKKRKEKMIDASGPRPVAKTTDVGLIGKKEKKERIKVRGYEKKRGQKKKGGSVKEPQDEGGW